MRVIGVGNLLLSDEGIGIHVVRALEYRPPIPGVEYVDGGVAGAGLLHLMEGEEKVVIVDAVDAPLPPGSVVKLLPEELSSSSGPRFSLHDLNLADAMGLMRLRETLPNILILGVVPFDIATWSMELTGKLRDRLPGILDRIEGEIRAFLQES